jgi:asparagine synthetase B (glutamine-hydrolysing)
MLLLYDSEKDVFLCARDVRNRIPLYYGTDEMGQFYVASGESFEGTCSRKIAPVPTLVITIVKTRDTKCTSVNGRTLMR